MIEHLIEFSIRNRWLIILAGLLLALGGIFAIYHTPVDAIPDLSENQVIVFTEWPGHSPPEIEAQITYPLSLHLQGLPGVRVVRSSSDFNFPMISVIFEDGVDFTVARDRVAQRLPRARDALPAGVEPSLAPDAAATGQIFWYTVDSAVVGELHCQNPFSRENREVVPRETPGNSHLAALLTHHRFCRWRRCRRFLFCGVCAVSGWRTSRRTSCRWPASPSPSACWSIRRS